MDEDSIKKHKKNQIEVMAEDYRMLGVHADNLTNIIEKLSKDNHELVVEVVALNLELLKLKSGGNGRATGFGN